MGASDSHAQARAQANAAEWYLRQQVELEQRPPGLFEEPVRLLGADHRIEQRLILIGELGILQEPDDLVIDGAGAR